MPPAPTKPSTPTIQKTQPWRAVWPTTESKENHQYERKAAGAQSLNGQYGFNDKGEGIAPKK